MPIKRLKPNAPRLCVGAVFKSKTKITMKKFLCLLGLMLMLGVTAFSAPHYDVGLEQSAQTVFVQADAQPMTVDFVYDYADGVTYTIATAAETEYMHYQALFAEVRTQVFDLTMPVFRLCHSKANAFKSHLYTGWRGVNSNPPSQYDRA